MPSQSAQPTLAGVTALLRRCSRGSDAETIGALAAVAEVCRDAPPAGGVELVLALRSVSEGWSWGWLL